MGLLKKPAVPRLALLTIIVLLGALLAWPLLGTAQDKPSDSAKHQHVGKTPDAEKLADQIRDLRAKVAQLEAALKQGHQAQTAPGKDGMPMGKGMKGLGMEGMMEKMMGKGGMSNMSGMSGQDGTGMMDMDRMEMMGMMGMAPKSMPGMKGMGKMQMKAALPGFPGASHIYHVGATDFFLDHPDHITLTAMQQTDLGRIKEKALLAKASAQRKIEEAEQELWGLTASDQPEAAKIEAKIREIEKLRGDQRLAFIRAVGDAAKVLSDEQRQALLGTGVGKADKADPHAGHKHP
jgi:hypothetical protein